MKQLDEKLLASDFTFGFELEAYLRPDILKEIPLKKDSLYQEFVKDAIDSFGLLYNEIVDRLQTYDDYIEFRSEYSYGDKFDELINSKKIYNKAEEKLNIEKYFPDNAKWIKVPSKGFTSDGSLGVDGFEWRSPVMVVTPEAVAHCIAFLKHIKKNVCYISDDCGFHTHISFADLSEDDARWIMLKLAEDPKMVKKIQRLCTVADRNKEYSAMEREPISFYSRWADTDYLFDLRDALRTDNIEGLYDMLSNKKYRALRIHPQGTLEWRSPREFLNEDYDDIYIKSFFLSLYDFISWMRDALDSTTIGNYDRDNLLKMIDSYGKNDNLFYKTADKKANSIKGMILNAIKNPNVLYKMEKLTTRQLYMGITKTDERERTDLVKSMCKLIISGKKVPEKILAVALYYCDKGLTSALCHYLKQPFPIKEMEKVSSANEGEPSVNQVVRCFKYLGKDEVLYIIKNTSVDYDKMWRGFLMDYMGNDHKLYLPTWLDNAIYEKYGKKIDVDRIKELTKFS